MENIRELTILSMIIRIVFSIIIGGLLGIERELKNRPAGLRTYMLVCMGACIVMITNQYVYQAFNTGDPARMSAQVISGIGFLGAGTIIVTSRNQIKGLTTAAGLWASACLGLAIGIGLYELGIAGGIAIFLILRIIHKWDYMVHMNSSIIELYIELKEDTPIIAFIKNLKRLGIKTNNIQIENDFNYSNQCISFITTLHGEKEQTRADILSLVENIDCVAYVYEL